MAGLQMLPLLEGECLSTLPKPDGLVCLMIGILGKPRQSFLEKILAVGETCLSCPKGRCPGAIRGLLPAWSPDIKTGVLVWHLRTT